MKIAIAVTLFFAGATSLLGARRSASLARASGKGRYWAAAAVASVLAIWMAFCGAWLLGYGA